MSQRQAIYGDHLQRHRAASIAQQRRMHGWVSLVFLLLFTAPAPGFGAEPERSGRKNRAPATSLGQLVAIGELYAKPERTFVICHGMGGMKKGDRFYRLAEAIRGRCHQVNVFLADWTEAANRRVWGINIPHLVAKSINPVGDDIADQLKLIHVNANQLTLIGESFGNCVNSRVAQRLGGASRILAFNPANEMGGHPLPRLEKHAEISWVFHTRSPFDTNSKIGDRGILLQPESKDAFVQHTYGVQWLTQCLTDGDTSWLNFERVIPASPTAKFYDLAIDRDGGLQFGAALRTPPGQGNEIAASSGSAIEDSLEPQRLAVMNLTLNVPPANGQGGK